jgi:hypothetical protein
MLHSYGETAPAAFTSAKQLENFVRAQLYDSGLTPSMVDHAFPVAMMRILATGAIADIQKKKTMKGFSGSFDFLSALEPRKIVKQISRTVEEVKKIVPEKIAHSATQALAALKPIGDLPGNAIAEIGRVGQGVKESVQDIYAENFGNPHHSMIPTYDQLLKVGDVDGNGFILTNKINRLLPIGVSINFIAQNQAMMGVTQWHDMNYMVNHLLPWLFKNEWISFDNKAQKWNMPFRSSVGQMNGTGRVGTGDFFIDIYGWHNLNDEAMLGMLTTFLPIFGYTPQMKADLESAVNLLSDSVQRKSGREWNRNATKIAASVIAIVAVAIFMPMVVGAVLSAVSAGLKLAKVKGEWTPDDILTKQLVDGTTGAVFPKSVDLPDTSANLDIILTNLKLNSALTSEQKNNAAVMIEHNKEIQSKSNKGLILTALAVSSIGVGIVYWARNK